MSERLRWSFGALSETREVLPPPSAREGRVFAGRYRFGSTLGRGAGGEVVRARDLVAGRDVAVKFLSDSLDSRKRERFQREGELLARLRHTGILGVHGGGLTEEGRPFLVLELVEDARGLESELAADPERGLDLLLEVARAVGFAHKQGVVHRDLKPDNVLVDREGRARVCDFGLGWRPGVDRLTQTGALLGTPLYMSPEQLHASSDAPLPQSDVWALGVMLYRHLTGVLPFEADTLAELASKIVSSAPTQPRKLAPDVSQRLEDMCLRALAKDPQARFADGVAFADALAKARHPLVAKSLRRWALLAATGTLLLAVAGAGGAWVVQRRRQRQAWHRTHGVLLERARETREQLERAARAVRLGEPEAIDDSTLTHGREVRQALADSLAAAHIEGELIRETRQELEGLTQALGEVTVAQALSAGDLDAAAQALSRLESRASRQRYEDALAARRDPVTALHRLQQRARESHGEARSEARFVGANAALAAGRLADAERLLPRLPVADSQVAALLPRLEARLRMAQARAAAAQGNSTHALERIEAAQKADPAAARAASGALVEDALARWRAGQGLRPTLALVDGLARILGESCLPRAAGRLYQVAANELSIDDPELLQRAVAHLGRMLRLDPKLTIPTLLSQRLMVEAMAAVNQGRLLVVVRIMELLVRAGSPYYEQIWSELEPAGELTLLTDLLPRWIAERDDWPARFIRAHATVYTLGLSVADDRTLGAQAEEDLRRVLAAPWLPPRILTAAQFLLVKARLRRSGEKDRYLEDLDALVRAGDPDPFRPLLAGAELLLEEKRFEEAISWAARCLQEVDRRLAEVRSGNAPPGSTPLVDGLDAFAPKACRILVGAHLELGRLPEAERYAQLLTGRTLRDSRHLPMAQVRFAQGRYREAATRARMATATEGMPNEAAVCLQVHALLQLGERAEARAVVEKAMQAAPLSETFRALLSEVKAD